jgi:hypothetical protein
MEQFMLDILNGKTSVYTWNDRETTDTLLLRDWFTDTEGIVEVLESADQNAWAYVCKNRERYSQRIQDAIASYRINSKIPTKLRVVDLTDREMYMIEKDIANKHDKAFEISWAEESKTLPPRPIGEIDMLVDRIGEALCDAKDMLANYLKSKKKKYVPPGAQVIVDPKHKKLEDLVHTLENEYTVLKESIKRLDTIYLDSKRDEYRQLWMP